MNRTRIPEIIAWLLLFMIAGTVQAESNSVSFQDSWIREAPPGITVLAAYCHIENNTSRKMVLKRVQSPSFKTIEIHKVQSSGEMMDMVKLDHLEIPKGAKIRLESGKLHLMLIGPHSKLEVGAKVPLDFTFEDGQTQRVQFEVRKSGS